MDPMEALVRSAVQAWTVQVERGEKRFGGLTDEQLLVSVAPGRNRLVYLWGHLIAVSDDMLPLLGLGERSYPELEAVFIRQPDRAMEQVPSQADLQRWWTDVHGRLAAGFATWAAQDWMGKHTRVSDDDFVANPLRNRLSVLLSRTSHMAYHLGQSALAS
jgi:hypothetical protein